MRLGLSTLLIAAIATAGLVGCGDSDTGAGGAGGGAGGSDTGTGGDDTGSGGDDTGSGGNGSGGGTSDGVCVTENVSSEAECDVDCDRYVTNTDAGVTKCTASCVDNSDCSDDDSIVCAEDESTGNTFCLPQCGSGFECDGEDVCDQESLLCLPDQISG